MNTIGGYLDYMARAFGVSSRTSLESKHLSIFKEYINGVLEDWEAKGDMDYLKFLGSYVTRAPISGTMQATKGQAAVVLSQAVTAAAIGCDLQAGGKTYVISKFVDSTHVHLFPAFLDSDVAAEPFQIVFNRFPVPPYFKKVMNERMYYLESLTRPHIIVEKDFAMIIKDNVNSRPLWFQVKYSARTPGVSGQATVSGSTAEITSGTVTPEMVGMPIKFAGDEEVYFIQDWTDSNTVVLDRARDTAISVAVAFDIIPKGWMFIEIYPFPGETKQIVYDYLATEVDKVGVNEVVLAPKTVVHSLLDCRLAQFTEDSASSRELLARTAQDKVDTHKSKTISDFTPSVKAYGWNLDTARGVESDYGFPNRHGVNNYNYLRKRR